MRVTIHQPEHFPYMGFFQKISEADVYVVLDNVTFRKNYFQNRNKIKTSIGKDQWITVPVEKKATSKHIKDVLVSQDFKWKKKLVATIKQNLSFDAYHIYCYDRLIDINMQSIKWAFAELKISTKIVYASDLDAKGSKSQLLANICKEVGATKYISGPSGKDYLDMSYFEGIEIEYFQPKVQNYYSCLYNILINKNSL